MEDPVKPTAAPEGAVITEGPATPPAHDDPGASDAQPAADDAAPVRTLTDRLRPALPWISLAMGVGSALMLDRSPARARMVPVVVGLAWVLLTGLLLLHRETPTDTPSSRWQRAARFSSLVVTQSLFQLTLFFVGPLYWQASAPTTGHVVFLALMGLIAATTLWDPLFHRLIRRPVFSIPLLSLEGFCGLDATLPYLGVSTGDALWISACLSGALAPVVAWIAFPAARGRAFLFAIGLGGLLPLAIWLGAGVFVPAAPLRVTRLVIGKTLNGRDVADPIAQVSQAPHQLYCGSSVWAPLGMKDELVHVWRQDGRVRDTIPLELKGGREAGYRTYSRKKNFGAEPRGVWTCSVETATGQVLDRREVRVGAAPGG